MIGNFIADSVKGRDLSRFSPDTIKGIKLHRAIDSFTDSHPAFCRSKIRLRKNYGKFCGVITDIFYDHFLASNWNDYSDESLHSFVEKVYSYLQENYELLPAKVQMLLPRMMENNWLYNYRLVEGIGHVLEGMSKRTNFNSGMELAVRELKIDYSLYKAEFQEFFPMLKAYVEDQ